MDTLLLVIQVAPWVLLALYCLLPIAVKSNGSGSTKYCVFTLCAGIAALAMVVIHLCLHSSF